MPPKKAKSTPRRKSTRGKGQSEEAASVNETENDSSTAEVEPSTDEEAQKRTPRKTPSRGKSKTAKGEAEKANNVAEEVEITVQNADGDVASGHGKSTTSEQNSTKKEPKKAKPPPPPPKKKNAQGTKEPLPISSTEQKTVLSKEKEDMLMFIGNDDLAFEEECIRSPIYLKAWLFYLDHKATSSLEARSFLFERALLCLPGSYKLWKAYSDLRVASVLDLKSTNPATGLSKRLKPVNDPEYRMINSIYERALILCNKHPVMWLNYARFLMHQPAPTKTRRVFDRALKSLPITQHGRIWDLYLKFAEQSGGETAIRIWRRYLKLRGLEAAEDYAELLLTGLDSDGQTGDDQIEDEEVEARKAPRYAEAARVLSIIMADPKYVSPHGKTVFQIWTEFCELVCSQADSMSIPTSDALFGTIADSSARADAGIQSIGKGLGLVDALNVEKVIRAGIAKFSDQVGRLWNSLARWYVSRGGFEKARDVYEEAMLSVTTVRDFTMVFDAYAEFEESVISSRMEEIAELEGREDVTAEDREDLETDVDIRLARLEKLMQRRPFLVNDVLLRQNPHNVHEWDRRAHLWRERGDLKKVVETYSEAVATIAPKKASGKLHLLWTGFATFYEDNSELDQARKIFERAVNVPYKNVEDLAELWCQWAEMELRHKEFKRALDVMGMATAPPRLSKKVKNLNSIRYNDDELPPQIRIFKSLKLWSFYVDLEEAIGTVESAKLVYERIMELKIATPQVIINCADFLEENRWFEESYKAYERGIEMFGYPIAFELWNLYLQKFVKRHGADKLERARDLFEHALDKCPPKFAKTLYLMYAKLEEDHGLTRHAMKIYDRATKAVSDADRFSVFEMYIAKSVSFFGRTSSREIYSNALEVLPDKMARVMAVRFAQMEASLFEVDRARAIWSYGSQFADPRLDPEYWKFWQEFETKHGNEDTFKEMLRLKRSVQAKFNTDISFISNQMLAQRAAAAKLQEVADEQTQKLNAELDEEDRQAGRDVGKIEMQPSGSRIVGFVPAKSRTTLSEVTVGAEAGATDDKVANPDEIEIDDEEEEEGGDMNLDDSEPEQDVDEEGKKELNNLQKRAIPDEVFGGLAKLKDEAPSEKKELGAKERFKRKR